MKNIMFFFLIIGCHLNMTANVIKGVFPKNGKLTSVSLFALNGIGEDFIAKITVIDGAFEFKVPENLKTGLFLLENDNNKSNKIFFIYKQKSVSFSTDINWNPDSTKYTTNENKLFKIYETKSSLIKQKIRLIKSFITYYPDKDNIYKSILEEYPYLEQSLTKFTDSIHLNLPNSFVSLLIKGSNLYIPSLTSSLDSQKENYKTNYWKNFPFNDKRIIRSDVIMSKTREYLLLHIDRRLTKKEQDSVYISSILKLFSNLILEKDVKYTFEKNIQQYFVETGNNEMAYFIDENYISNSCELAVQEEAKERILAFKNTQPGSESPLIEGVDIEGNKRSFSSKTINAKYSIIYFWSSKCAHCKESLPKLITIKKDFETKNIDFIGISLDVDKENCMEFIKKNNLDIGFNFNQPDGWKGQMAKSFGINSTPTYFIIDQNWIIKKRPSNIYEIRNFLFKNTPK